MDRQFEDKPLWRAVFVLVRSFPPLVQWNNKISTHLKQQRHHYNDKCFRLEDLEV